MVVASEQGIGPLNGLAEALVVVATNAKIGATKTRGVVSGRPASFCQIGH